MLFLIETFLKPNKLDWVYKYLATRFSEKTDKDRRKAVEFLPYVADRLKVERISSLDENVLETVWLIQIHPYKSNRPFAFINMRTRMPG